jgi:hypothetical protein
MEHSNIRKFSFASLCSKLIEKLPILRLIRTATPLLLEELLKRISYFFLELESLKQFLILWDELTPLGEINLISDRSITSASPFKIACRHFKVKIGR